MKSLTRWVNGNMEEDVRSFERKITPYIWVFIITAVCYFLLVATIPDNPTGRPAYQSKRVRMVAPVMAVMDDGRVVRVTK